jgi:diguanylate cyclase (GGDEF)-like protein
MHADFIKLITNPLAMLKLSGEDLDQLLHAGNHSHYLSRHRSGIIIERTRMVAIAFSILTFLWIGLDYIAFNPETWLKLAVLRLTSTLIFICLSWPWKLEHKLSSGFIMMVVMMTNPSIFYVAAHMIFVGQELSGLATMIATVYTMLPYIIIAGLSIFPLTALEAVLFALPILTMTAFTPQLAGTGNLMDSLATLWIMGLILGVYLMAGMSQLHSMISMVHRASKDPLTDLLTRRTGAEIIDIHFRISALHNTPFSVMFLDLDHFKAINDDYGHEAGDEALRNTAKRLHEYLRRSDAIVRWGGEEIVAVLPNTDINGIKLILERILKDWLGERPEGKPLTASIGVAERMTDDIDDWPDLIELADKRMYEAKKSGRARAVLCGEEVMASS